MQIRSKPMGLLKQQHMALRLIKKTLVLRAITNVHPLVPKAIVISAIITNLFVVMGRVAVGMDVIATAEMETIPELPREIIDIATNTPTINEFGTMDAESIAKMKITEAVEITRKGIENLVIDVAENVVTTATGTAMNINELVAIDDLCFVNFVLCND